MSDIVGNLVRQQAATLNALARLEVELAEARDAAQKFFEEQVAGWEGTDEAVAARVTVLLARWPWLRPNPYLEEK
jgi:hypothetical protein